MKNTFDFKKFKGNGSYASVLRDSNDQRVGVCYSKSIEAAIGYFKRAYRLSGTYTLQSHVVYNHVSLGDATYRDIVIESN